MGDITYRPVMCLGRGENVREKIKIFERFSDRRAVQQAPSGLSRRSLWGEKPSASSGDLKGLVKRRWARGRFPRVSAWQGVRARSLSLRGNR
ncbi:hypothetical protein NL676_004891 [Syzygium grande]|nr:hypothetical protein NL676_004891 [Syzygium grande]